MKIFSIQKPGDSVANIADICKQGIINLVQLHGHEDREYINSLAKSVKIPIIKAVHVENSQQITDTENLDCDYLLLDTAYKDKIGGGGQKFNWDLIPKNLSKHSAVKNKTDIYKHDNIKSLN